MIEEPKAPTRVRTFRPGEKWVEITKGGSGWFAVMLWWNPDMGGFMEPYETGDGRYSEPEVALSEARGWAAAEEVEFWHDGVCVQRVAT